MSSRAIEVVLVDAFTSTPFTGNPAAVVPDAVGLDEAAMRETGGLVAADGVARFRAEQGDFVGRPGRLDVEVHGAGGRARRVRVGGQAVIMLTGTLCLP